MDIIRTSIGITKTIRNVSRLREIVSVFAKHGFDEFISLGVTNKIPNFVLPKSRRSIKEELEENQDKDWAQTIGYRLRLCFEELGPAFIKFGQLLSSREDILPTAFIDEMKILRDKVKSVNFSEVRGTVQTSLGLPVDEVFESVEEKPIGTASIGVVYRGVLKNGEKVVIKVRRPGIEKMMETDFSILRFLASQAEKVSDEVRYLGVSRVVNDFSSSLVNELNFHIEAMNASRFRKIVENHDHADLLYVPKFYEEYTREDLLVMEFLDGIPFSNDEKISPYKEELKDKLDDGLKIFIKTFLKDGFFHADLHGGNFFYLPDGKIGLIDFGLMGRLSKKGRQNFIAIVYAILTFNYENLVYEFLDVAEYESIPDVDALIADVRDALSPYIGLTVQQTDYNIVLREIISTLKRHEIHLPSEWFIVFRALMTLDGAGRSLGFDFDIYALMESDIHEIIKENLNKDELIEEGIWTARDFISFGRVIPRHLKWYLKEWARNGYGHQLILSGHEGPLKMINSSLVFLGFMLLCCVFIVSGVVFIGSSQIGTLDDIPTISWIFWSFGVMSFLRASVSLKN